MDQTFTWSEKAVFEGNRQVILGLLEDIHRFSDGMPARKKGLNAFDEIPYLGKL